jgi:hypothetical protein
VLKSNKLSDQIPRSQLFTAAGTLHATVHMTKARLRLELELHYNVILDNKIIQITRKRCNSEGLSKGKCILKGDVMFIENVQRLADAIFSRDAPC